MNEPATEVVIQTATGQAAIAVVAIRGPGAVSAVRACFQAANGRPLAEQPLNAIRFGRWRRTADNTAPGEELVVCRTSDHVVEVHCHGGDAAAAAIVADLVAQGCVQRSWRDAPILAADSAIAAEARLALADCSTDRAAGILLDQLEGALERSANGLLEQLPSKLSAAANAIDRLLARAEWGLHLATPWRVVLAGPPNVGKSSLINALVGYQRSVVFDEPGVTRDVVTAAAAIGGWPVELADTAGLRLARDELEAAGVGLARDAAEAADLVLLVDAVNPSQPGRRPASAGALLAELGLNQQSVDRSVLRVVNKIDLAVDAASLLGDERLLISATRGDGLAALVDAIAARLVPEPPEPTTAVPFTARQIACLQAARQALDSHDADAARAAVQALLAGESPARG